MKRLICIIILVFFLFFIYGKYINTKGLEVKEYEITSNKLTNGFDGIKIVQFSDILYYEKSDIKEIKNLVKSINNENANIVVFTGDLVLDNTNITNVINELKNIKSDYKYAILGDKDNNNIKSNLESIGFTVLDKNYDYIFNKDINPIKIMNLNNFDENILTNEEEITPSFTIGLLHKPDEFEKLKNYDIDVIFAGHSLGGQLRLPFWGATLKKDGASIYTNDYYNENNTRLYVSFGIGTNPPHIRTFNKPSINVYRLKKI